MSFILDALRKSENERQQSSVPRISDVPAVVQSTRTPKWILGVIVALSVGVLLLGWAWWQSTSISDADVTTARPAGVLPRTTTESPAATSDDVRNLAQEPATAETAPLSSSPAPVAVAQPEPETPTIIVAAPTMMELLATGTMLPDLTLELHVYSGTPAQRLVRINSASYREGDVLSDGPRVVSITPEGVILDHGGQNFLLSAE